MTEVTEIENETVEETVEEKPFDPREWARIVSGAYRHKTFVDNTHLPEINRQKLIPVKETFEGHTEHVNHITGGWDVIASENIRSGGLIEECSYVILETRLNHFISNTKDKIGSRIFWTIPCEEENEDCKEYGPHVILPRGNAMSYRMTESPNAYYIVDEVTRTIRFYALRPIDKGEVITLNLSSPEVLSINGITAKVFSDISGIPMAFMGTQGGTTPSKPGGCSSCAKKAEERAAKEREAKEKESKGSKVFRARSVEDENSK